MPDSSKTLDAIVIDPEVIEAELVEVAPKAKSTEDLCNSCGGTIVEGDRFCTGCGKPHDIPNLPPREKTCHLRCETCSAEIAMDLGHRSYTCPFCDSTYVVEFTMKQSGRRQPEFVVGFAVTREEALQKFRAWLEQNQWFRPKDLSVAAIEEKQQGVYLPFWTFSTRVESAWRARIGEYWYETEYYWTTVNGKRVRRSRRVRRTEWWPLSGWHHRYYSGYMISASRGLPQADAQSIQPFDLTQLARYRPHFLAGWLNEEYSVDDDRAWSVFQNYFFQVERSNVARHLPGDCHRELQVQSNFYKTGTDLVLLPVHILCYRYEDKVFRFLVNGQTGKFAGEKPISTTKVTLVVVVVIAMVLCFIALLIGMSS